MILNIFRSRCRRLTPAALLLVIFLPLLSVSCRSGKSAGASSGVYQPSAGAALGRQELRDLFDRLEGSYTSWDEMKVPVNLSLKSPKRFNVGGTLTMVRDRSIHLSFRFLGMEVASVMVTPDSIYALYKLERIYFAEKISDLLGGFPATVGNVQDMLLGRPFVLGENAVHFSDCKIEGTAATWSITPSRSPFGMSYDFTVDTPTGNVELLTVNIPSRAPITAEYSDFASSATGPLAGTTLISAPTSRGTFSGELELNPRKAEWGRGYARSWSVPRGYTRVKAADILGKLKQK